MNGGTTLADTCHQLRFLIDSVSNIAPDTVSEKELVSDQEVNINDPFDKSRIQLATPTEHRQYVTTLVERFEKSLRRILSVKGIDKDLITNRYRQLLRKVLNERYGLQALDFLDGKTDVPVNISQLQDVKISTVIVDGKPNDDKKEESDNMVTTESSETSTVSDTTTSGNGSSDTLPSSESLKESSQVDRTNGGTEKCTKKRAAISKETRAFLEKIFQTKSTPNKTERTLIAEKCGITPLQVRVWFTNKRMRIKNRE